MTGIYETIKNLRLLPVIYWIRNESVVVSLFPLITLLSIDDIILLNARGV